jgi:uncharacterized protein (TIGR03437 family)
VTDQAGHLIYSGNPAKLGQFYTVWLTGLGYSIQNQAAAPQPLIQLSQIPEYGSTQTAWTNLQPSFAGPSPQFSGVFQINLQIPTNIATGTTTASGAVLSEWPCGGYQWEMILGVFQGSEPSVVIGIPVTVSPGDVSCK